MTLKLFIWNVDYKTDWSSGIGIALAENVEQARELLRAQNVSEFRTEFYDVLGPPNEILEIDKPCVVCDECGGS